MDEEMSRDRLKDIFQPLISRLSEEKGSSKNQVTYLWWFPRITCLNIYCTNNLWEGVKINWFFSIISWDIG